MYGGIQIRYKFLMRKQFGEGACNAYFDYLFIVIIASIKISFDVATSRGEKSSFVRVTLSLHVSPRVVSLRNLCCLGMMKQIYDYLMTVELQRYFADSADDE